MTKRFQPMRIIDNIVKVYDSETDGVLDLNTVCEKLNEQQATISALKKENEQLRQKLDFYLLDEFEWKEKYGD